MAYIDIHDSLLVTQDEYLVDLEPKFYDGDLAIGVDIDAEDSSADGGLANEKLNSQNQKEDEEKLEQINLKAEFQVHSSSASVLIDFGDEFSSSLDSSSMLQ
ncbi:unnamed protein product [Amaranthus hypochondriacus]